jgi:hypothetical protein
MANDVFAVSRKLLESDLWLNEPFTRAQAWIDLIGLARWRNGHARINGAKIVVNRGELCWSQMQLAKRWKWSRGKVIRFLNELETEQQIVQRKQGQTVVISLLNFDRYQFGGTTNGTTDERPTGQQTIRERYNGRTADRTTDGTRKNKGNKDKKENNPPPPTPSGIGVVDWEVVEDMLFHFGVAKTDQCVKAVQKRGLSPDRIADLITHWQSLLVEFPNRWRSPPGVLYERIKNDRLDSSVADHWPPPDEATQRRVRTEKRRENERQKRQSEAAQDQAIRQAESDLEGEYQSQWDAMTPDQQGELGRLVSGERWKLIRGKPALIRTMVFDYARQQNIDRLSDLLNSKVDNTT